MGAPIEFTAFFVLLLKAPFPRTFDPLSSLTYDVVLVTFEFNLFYPGAAPTLSPPVFIQRIIKAAHPIQVATKKIFIGRVVSIE